MKDIPIHQLQSRSSSGMEIKYFIPGEVPADIEKLGAHRDDHYIFFLLEHGVGSLMIDFQEVKITGPALYYVLPGQVHHRIRNEYAVGWFVAVDTLLIPPAQRNVFENQLLLQQSIQLNDAELFQFRTMLQLLNEKFCEDDQRTFYLPIIHALLQGFVGMAAAFYSEVTNTQCRQSRVMELSQQFKRLLVQQMRTVRSPSAYAGQLNVSESYLNEALKKTTGLSVSYWIQHEVLMEAKRLLYYSDMNVKQIAHTLGYDDHTYFSRQFRKVTGITPLGFRVQYRK